MQTIRQALLVEFPGNRIKNYCKTWSDFGHIINLQFLKRVYNYQTPCNDFNNVIYTPLHLLKIPNEGQTYYDHVLMWYKQPKSDWRDSLGFFVSLIFQTATLRVIRCSISQSNVSLEPIFCAIILFFFFRQPSKFLQEGIVAAWNPAVT